MKTTLENLPSAVKENRLKQFGENIVKYQNFKTSAIINKIDNCGYTKSSLMSYINFGINYIKTSFRERRGGSIYDYIDEALAKHIQPLTPTAEEHRVQKKGGRRKKYKSDNITPVERVLKEIEQKTSIPKNLKYAVKMNKNLRIMDSIEEARAFQDGLTFMGNISTELVKITYEVI